MISLFGRGAGSFRQNGWMMAYKLKPGKLKPKAVRRIAREQVSRALEVLSNDPVSPAGVHECRKVVKRLRSLLRLLQPSLEPKAFDAIYKDIGKVGDLLAGTRDIHVMQQTVAALESHYGEGAKATLAPLKAVIARKASDAHDADAAAIEKARIAFVAEARKFEKLKLSEKGFAAVRAGLQETYKGACVHLKRAYANPGDERFHELRKRVQWHWRHMALLSRLWPAYFALRVSACQQLAELLGDDHDLAVLLDHARHAGANEGVDVAGVRKLIVKRQKELRAAARSIAERLFAEAPAAFGVRMQAYWDLKSPPPAEV